MSRCRSALLVQAATASNNCKLAGRAPTLIERNRMGTNNNSPIESTKTEWGTQLKIRPFNGINGTHKSTMVIQADVQLPKTGRKAGIRIWFSGVTGGANISRMETGIWMNAMRGLLEEAQRIGSAMKAPAKKRPTSRSTK